MKLLDEKGRFFGKVNIFDFVVITLLAIGCIGMAVRLLNPNATVNTDQKASYVFEINNVQEFCTTAYHVGDTLYEKGVNMGKITDVKVSPYQSTKLQPDGSYKLVDHVLYYNVVLTVSTDRLRNKNGYYIGKQEVLNGTVHTLCNGFVAGEGTVRQLVLE